MDCNCDCNNKNKLNIAEVRLPQGNMLRLAIPLTKRVITLVNGQVKSTDYDFVPNPDYPVEIILMRGKVEYPYVAEMRDGNIACMEDAGTLTTGTYALEVRCHDDQGAPCRFKQRAVVNITDYTADAGILPPVEFEVQEWYLNPAIFLLMKGDKGDAGRGIADIEIIQSHDSLGANIVTIVLDDGTRKPFVVYNGVLDANDVVLDTLTAHGLIALDRITLSGVQMEVVTIDNTEYLQFSKGGKTILLDISRADKVVMNNDLVNNYYDIQQIDAMKLIKVHVTRSGNQLTADTPFYRIAYEVENGNGAVAILDNVVYSLSFISNDYIMFSDVLLEENKQTLLIVDNEDAWELEEHTIDSISMNDVEEAIAELVDSAPATLDTLKELAAALGDDPNFATTMATELGKKVDKVTGKGLSTNDYTTAEKNKLAGLSNYDDTALAARVTDLEGRKRHFIELEPDNQGNPMLEDQDGNFLTAAEFIALMQRPDLHEVQMYYQRRVYYFDIRYDQGDGWRFWAVESARKRYMIVERNDETEFGLTFEIHNDMINASDIETGLEEQFMTQTEKDKLGGIAAGAQVNVKADWNAASGDAQILNKPTIPAAQVQSDWNAASGMGAILNKPTIPTKVSELDNDSGFITGYTETDPTVPAWAKASTKPTYTATEVGALPNTTTIPTKVSDLTNDSGFINKSVFAGTCTTAAATMPKVCTVDTFKTTTSGGVTHAADRTMIAVMFTNSDTNTSAVPTLNVNNIGAKAIYYSNAKITSTAKNTIVAGTAKTLAYYYYDASLDDGNGAWVYMGKSVDSNNTYSNASLGQGYAVQSNSAAATAITASISSYALTANGIVAIKFNYDVPASATLNISSKGAKAIYNQGAPIAAGVIKAGDVATFIYSTYYHLIAVDSWQDKQDAINDLDDIRSGAALGATALQSYTETDPTVPSWAKQSSKPSYTASDVGAVPVMASITHANLVTARTNSNLIPGAWYRITDYVCTTTQNDTQSAGHQFDILVLATSPNTLSEEARAIRHAGDTYFANSNLEAWKIWYCLDNDTTRFAWADSTNGKGVIYRMIDEWNNDCPYDFKNIQYKRDLTDGELVTDNGTTTWVYTFNWWDANNEVCKDYSIFGNTLRNDESFVNGVYDNRMGVVNSYLTYYGEGGNKTCFVLPNNVFLAVGEDFDFYYSCYGNTLGDNCYDNTFGNNCYSNTFDNNCYRNTLGAGCAMNHFGIYSSKNKLGNDCVGNHFGIECEENVLGETCENNMLGSYCNNNIFGIRVSDNTFGIRCYGIVLANACTFNTFGNYCSIQFQKPFTRNVIVESENKKIILTSTQTPTNSTPLRNITIAQGVNNTNNTKTISHNTVNDTFRTTYVATNSVEVQV